jgi:hypothetical protein
MFNLNAITDKVLNSYGWHIEDTTDYLDRVIMPGEFVHFYDDELNAWGYGVYEGWYEDLNRSGDTSPFFNESYEGIDRLVITEAVINPDGSVVERRNYILPENCYEGFTGDCKTFDLLAA